MREIYHVGEFVVYDGQVNKAFRVRMYRERRGGAVVVFCIRCGKRMSFTDEANIEGICQACLESDCTAEHRYAEIKL